MAVAHGNACIRAYLTSNSADRIDHITAETAACNRKVFDDSTVAEPAEQTACVVCRAADIPDRMVCTVEMSAEAAGHIVGYAAPVAGILHVDILRHLEVNAGGVHILIIGIVTEVDKVVRSLDKIRILLRSLSRPRHALAHLNSNGGAEDAVRNADGIGRELELCGSGELVIGKLAHAAVAVSRSHLHTRRVKGIALVISDLVGSLFNTDGNCIRLVSVKCRLAADKLYGCRKGRIVSDIAALRYGYRTECRECRLKLCSVVGGGRIDSRRDSSLRSLDCGLRLRAALAAHIVECTHSVLKSPVGDERVGRLVGCHRVPAAVHDVAEAAVGYAEAEHAVKQRLSARGYKALILRGVDT